ncbi:hypothetical protein CTAYLR_000301 [Chrysophaeum taylorii]|uniref:Protein kinase domain-containing protein n=1 Tax=Chrysophaeum taylorii TaxID=2483200 RepID=A0AAD7UEH3_9STRA|nr:hypothetical protein CTAYLR_000301 [Chrysophaeum taylorii]
MATRPHTERPLYKMSVQLIDTYKLINKVYYERKTRRKTEQQHRDEVSSEWDDENYDYVVNLEDAFGEHYVIKDRIGKGSFGQVVRARDTRTQSDVAIKIIKSKKPFALQARTEIELLLALRSADRDDKHNIVRLVDHFTFRGHQCLVFEMLSYNLYELLKNTQFHGVSLNLVRKFAKQILHALAFLARPDVAIIHCDLKPENILLRHPKRSAIKVIDFGSSCRMDRRMYSYIQSRFYRSPEVMLGLPYTVAIDVWSLGCILVEMHTGEPLFSGADQLDQMRKLVDVLGMPPEAMINAADRASRDQFFDLGADNRWALKRRPRSASDATVQTTTSEPHTSMHEDHRPRGIASIVGAAVGGPGGRRKGEPGHADQNYKLFLDLIHRMLDYSPTTRIKPDEALRHSFLNDSVWASTHVLSSTPPPPPPHSGIIKHPVDYVGDSSSDATAHPARSDAQLHPARSDDGRYLTNGDARSISAPTAAPRRRSSDPPPAQPMDVCAHVVPSTDNAGHHPRICDAGTQTSIS